MARLNGSSPGVRCRPLEAGRQRLRKAAASLTLWGVSALASTAGNLPSYFRAALSRFDAEVPSGWAYTLTTTRNAGNQITERFDPSRPAGRQWTLLLHNGKAPTPEELDRYVRSKAGGTPSAPQATFRAGDIDSGSVSLVSEDTARAEFLCSFREEATRPDKMLGRLALRLTVAKEQPHIEKFSLELMSPYSPVLGVKMHELRVQMSFAPPGPDRPPLPTASSSHFVGRIFFIRVEENLEVAFAAFTPAK